ncbi:MAG: ATP-binding protein [Candidatus Eremiobacterota bacterium]
METKITIAGALSEIKHVESFFDRLTEKHNIPADTRFKIDMVMDEILTNIISYGYKDNREHYIDIYVHIENNIIKIVIEDDAIAFNPLLAPPPDLTIPLEERPIGGLGIYLVKTSVNTIDYARENGRNILSMTMDLSATDQHVTEG